MGFDEEFLTALSFAGSEGGTPPRASTERVGKDRSPSALSSIPAEESSGRAASPALYSMTSAAALYPSSFLCDSEPLKHSSGPPPASQPPLHGYAYGAWVPNNPSWRTAAEKRSAESRVHGAVSEAERQRRILDVERAVTEEQRQRLEASLSSSVDPFVRGHSFPSGAAAAPSASPPRREVSGESMSPPSEEAGDCDDQGRGLSLEALPPPSSPSPPSAHTQKPQPYLLALERLTPEECTVGDGVASVPYEFTPSPSEATLPRKVPSAENGGEPDTLQAQYGSASPSRAHSAEVEERLTSPSPAQPLRATLKNTSLRSPSDAVVTVRQEDVRVDDEERLYTAYRRTLARIHEALRISKMAREMPPVASESAQLAYQRRSQLTTPPPRWGFSPSPLMITSSSPTSREGASQHHHVSSSRTRIPPLLPLAKRAPSLGIAEDDTVAPLPLERCRRLRWDLAHSGNVTVSSDGYVCRADAAEALAQIEHEYADRLSDVLPRLVIPLYALGTAGVTHGRLTFSFRWESRLVQQRHHGGGGGAGRSSKGMRTPSPALAFGFATRAFTGYGTAGPAFLYLSSGVIAPSAHHLRGDDARTEVPYGAPYEPGLVLSACLDLTQGELEFFVEGVSMGVAYTFFPAQHPAPLFPVVIFSAETDTAELLYAC